jgi:hypothetical protein
MKTNLLWLLALTTGSMMLLAVSTEKTEADIESAPVPSTVAQAPSCRVPPVSVQLRPLTAPRTPSA